MFESLRPNCLLTRHPILLLTVRRGLSDLFRPTRWYSHILKAHGYQVERFALASNEDPQIHTIFNHGRRVHLICDDLIRNSVTFSALPTEVFASLTTLQFAPFSFKNFYLRLGGRQKKLWQEQILNLAISLAESDLKRSQ